MPDEIAMKNPLWVCLEEFFMLKESKAKRNEQDTLDT